MINRRRRRKLGLFVLVGYLILLHLALAIAILRPYRAMAVVERVRERLAPGWRPSEFWSTMVAMQARVDASAAGSVLFLGDSGFQSMNVSRVAPNAVNYGIGADTIEGLSHRLPVYRSLPAAKAIVLGIGSNDLAGRDAASVAVSYERLVADIDRKVPLVVSAVLPVDERSIRRPLGFRDNAQIRTLNRAIERICAERPNCFYVNAGPMLIDETGNLRSDYHEGDGLHLTVEGYRVWMDALREALHAVGAV